MESFILYSEFANIGFLTFVHNLDSTIFCGFGRNNVYTVGELDKQNTNIINYLQKDSDMSLQLKVGSNDVLILNNAESANTLSYRQKYIGV